MLAYSSVFVLGCALVWMPAFYQASLIHADETARHEPTMSPGIHMFVGLLFAPIGGLFAITILYLIRSKKDKK